ncbi:response regulator [Roseibium sp.]|uniref:response regulator n=1 Tax=Roseibium sp. TaxID=1936156 RepID=UPI003A9750C6
MKILVVDDDPVIREILAEILSAYGFSSCRFAASGKEALEIVQEEFSPFDCFLLDIQMPEMTGIQLTAKLRKKTDYQITPIVMITAINDRNYVDNAFSAGATDYINKPFDIGELQARLKLIESLVNERRNKVSLSTRNFQKSNRKVKRADLKSPLHISDIDGAIDYLAMENYLLQMSRMSLFGSCVFGVAIQDGSRIFSDLNEIEFQFIIADVMEAISDCLKPHKFMITHVGCGTFACVRDSGRSFISKDLLRDIMTRLSEMNLHHNNGSPIIIRVTISEPIQLDLKSPKATVHALISAAANAEAEAEDPGHVPPSSAPFSLASIMGRN